MIATHAVLYAGEVEVSRAELGVNIEPGDTLRLDWKINYPEEPDE